MSLQRVNEIGTHHIGAHLALWKKVGGAACGTEGVAASSGHKVLIEPNGLGIDVIVRNKRDTADLQTFHVEQGPKEDIPDGVRKRHFGE